MIVIKFGGSSVATSERISKVSKIINSYASDRPLVVVSGLGGVTDSLIDAGNAAAKGIGPERTIERIIKRHLDVIEELRLAPRVIDTEIRQARRLYREISWAGALRPKALDAMMSFGERFSARIVAATLVRDGVEARAFDAYDAGVLTDSNFGNAEILEDTHRRIREFVRKTRPIPVVTGFIGMDRKGNITTLGRGGSDYTASVFGAAANAEQIQIWTNVDGIMTADPRVVSGAKSLASVTFMEELELEYLGSSTLHPKGIIPAMNKGIEVKIMNTLNTEYKGTLITKDIRASRRIASITQKDGITVIKARKKGRNDEGDLFRKASSALARRNIAVISMTTSRDNITMVLNNAAEDEVRKLADELEGTGILEIVGGLSMVSVVGKAMGSTQGIMSRMVSAVGNTGIFAFISSESGMSKSIIVNGKEAKKAVRLLHMEFFGE